VVGLILIFLVLFAVLAVVVAGGALVVQGYIYSEPANGLAWRGPAAAAVLTFFFAVWAALDYRGLDPQGHNLPYETILRFSHTDTQVVDRLWSVKNDKEILFTRKQSGSHGAPEFADENGQPWQRGDTRGIMKAIIVEDPTTKAKVRFEPKLTADGNFQGGGEQFPGYFEVKGRRTMTQLGQVTSVRFGLLIANLLLNGVHLVLWFICLWLIVRFQWTHAFFLAGIFWMGATLWIVPMLLDRTAAVARERRGIAMVAPSPQPIACARVAPAATAG